MPIHLPISKISLETKIKGKHIVITTTKFESFLQTKINCAQPTTEQK